MKIAKYTVAALSLALLSHTAIAKGLDDLQPSDKAQDPDTKTLLDETKVKEAEAPVQAAQAENTPAPAITGQYFIKTGLGWASLSKESADWRAAGGADITLGYKVPIPPIAGNDLFATFRYAPMDVAPNIKEGSESLEYVGVVEGFHFGALSKKEVKPNITASAIAELGMLVVALDDQLNLKKNELPEDSGINLNLGGGATYTIEPGFNVGGTAIFGFGSFTSMQILLSTEFTL